MKTLLIILTASVISAAFAKEPQAQNSKTDKEVTRRELQQFDEFLDSHPSVACELRAEPELVNRADFQLDHPDLKEFLDDHPHARAELKVRPRTHIRKQYSCEEHSHSGHHDHDDHHGGDGHHE